MYLLLEAIDKARRATLHKSIGWEKAAYVGGDFTYMMERNASEVDWINTLLAIIKHRG